MGVLVKGRHLLEGSAAGSKVLSMSFSGKGIYHRTNVLVGDVLQVEGKMSWASNGEVGSDVAAVLGQGRDEQTDRSQRMVALARPLAPACRPTRRAWLHQRSGAPCRNGTQETELLISGDGSFEELDGPRMLSKDSPCQRNASEQNLASRFESEGGSSVEGDEVGGVGAVGPDRFGDGGGELGERAFSRRRRFDPIKASREH